MQQYNDKKKHLCLQSSSCNQNISIRSKMQCFHNIPERSPLPSPWYPLNAQSLISLCCISQALLRLRNEQKSYLWREKSLFFVDVLMSDNLVSNPVKDVEDEESQRKSRPGDCVYSLGSVHKLFPHGVYVFWEWRLRVRSWSSVLNGWAILCWQTLTHVVANKVKAAFTHIIVLNKTKHMHVSAGWSCSFQSTFPG